MRGKRGTYGGLRGWTWGVYGGRSGIPILPYSALKMLLDSLSHIRHTLNSELHFAVPPS